jgi:hypothetical protein
VSTFFLGFSFSGGAKLKAVSLGVIYFFEGLLLS